jgi:sodium-dependent dicarboxylate transporter 2/3/5
MNISSPVHISLKRLGGLLCGPLLFVFTLYTPLPEGMSPEAQSVLACTLWIACWWILEPVPIPVSSLLPIVLLPLSGAVDLSTTAASYANPVIFLFLGGFIIALALEEWKLHKRIALSIILYCGTNQRMIVFGFMTATAFLSMWISNTATAMMMMPIGLAIVHQLGKGKQSKALLSSNPFGKSLMLGIAYAASIGGLATLIGTPGNAILAAIVGQLYQQEISFARWMLLGTPLTLTLLLICWYYLVRIAFPLGSGSGDERQHIQQELAALGPLGVEEKWVSLVFLCTAFAWISRGFLLNRLFPALDDSMIAIAASVLLFMIPSPSRQYKEGLLRWDIAARLPWGILLLFGAGLAIASGFQASGLAAYIGSQLELLQGLGLFLILLAIITLINFLTELTSNVATATMMLPILASLASAIGVHPYGLMVAACLASSCAFMLPVATPPNAVVFGSGYLRMTDMLKAGFWLNLLFILIITLYIYFLMPLLWDIRLQELPIFVK